MPATPTGAQTPHSRPSGLPSVGDIPWGTHASHFFQSAEDFVGVLVPYFAAGLQANERCIWVTSKPFDAALARQELRRAVPDLDDRIASGQLEVVGHLEGYLRSQGLGPGQVTRVWQEREREACAAGYDGLRIADNASWTEVEDGEALAAYECAIHERFRDHRILAVCSYPLDLCDSDKILDVLRHHQFALVFRDGAWQVMQSATMMLSFAQANHDHDSTHAEPVLAPPDRAVPAKGGTTAAPAAHHGHAVRFFHHDNFPADRIVDDLVGALAAGEAAAAFATRGHLYRISSSLRQRGVAVAEAIESGRLMLRDANRVAAALAAEGAQQDHIFDHQVRGPLERAIERFGRVRAYGEIVDVLARAGSVATALELEHRWNALIAERPVELLCGYTIGNFAHPHSAAMFREICAVHGTVEPAERRDDVDMGRVLAELQQSTVALQRESTRRERVERHRNRLREAERTHRTRAATVTEHLALLQRFTSAMSEAPTPAAIATIASRDLTAILGADDVVFAVPADQGDRLLLLAGDDAMARRGWIPGDEPRALTAAFTSGTPVLLTSGHEIAERFPAEGPDVRTLWCVPISAGGQRVGVVGLTYRTERGVSTQERALVEDFVRQVGLALERARLFERARRERDRAQVAWERAEEASRAKDEFLAMLGHELRNPLSPILTAVQLMHLRAGGLLVKERTIIERQVNHMVRLIDDLLDVSRIARGKVQLKKLPIELAEVVASAIEIASPVLEERAHKLVVHVPASGLAVEVDANRIAQVLVNLLTNAARYTPPNGLVEITCSPRDGQVSVSICDNGVGIDPAMLPVIFDVFVQGRQGSDRAQGGLGLGLAIARNLVEQHGGTLEALSDGVGKGSTFTFVLPLIGHTPELPVGRRVASSPRPNRHRILVVDDNVDAADVLGEALSAIGHQVRMAPDGPTALEMVAQFQPDAVLIDLGLPVMDGYELAQRLANECGEACPRLIAVSGYGQPADLDSSRAVGFEDHLVKPVSLGTLEAALERAFAR